MTRFARVLVRKSERALKSARLDLTDRDYDSAVNRSYYAMFDIARAALLRAGVAEDKLPRTHSGVIDAFRQHAVQSGQIDRELAADLSRTESHRIKADYTGIEIEPKIAAKLSQKPKCLYKRSSACLLLMNFPLRQNTKTTIRVTITRSRSQGGCLENRGRGFSLATTLARGDAT